MAKKPQPLALPNPVNSNPDHTMLSIRFMWREREAGKPQPLNT